jgi:hypothetical protein
MLRNTGFLCAAGTLVNKLLPDTVHFLIFAKKIFMKFTHRLAYYLLGVLIGGMFLFFIFKNKRTEFCYMPNCRVLKSIRSKPIVYSSEAKVKFAEKWVTIEDIKKCTEFGDVNFSKSNTRYKGGKLYVIEGKNIKDEPIEVEMVNYDDKVLLKDIKKQEKN